MKELMNFLFLSCKRATFLIEKREINGLSPMEKLQLMVHTSMCDACRSYQKQSSTLSKAVSQWLLSRKQQKETLSAEVKERIIKGMGKS